MRVVARTAGHVTDAVQNDDGDAYREAAAGHRRDGMGEGGRREVLR